jgi:hypothetical protein
MTKNEIIHSVISRTDRTVTSRLIISFNQPSPIPLTETEDNLLNLLFLCLDLMDELKNEANI